MSVPSYAVVPDAVLRRIVAAGQGRVESGHGDGSEKPHGIRGRDTVALPRSAFIIVQV
jgi:hypothetical protein